MWVLAIEPAKATSTHNGWAISAALPILVFDTRPFSDPRVRQYATGVSPSLITQCWGYRFVPLSGVYLGAGDLNLGSCVCGESSFPNELSLQLCYKMFSSALVVCLLDTNTPLTPQSSESEMSWYCWMSLWGKLNGNWDSAFFLYISHSDR